MAGRTGDVLELEAAQVAKQPRRTCRRREASIAVHVAPAGAVAGDAGDVGPQARLFGDVAEDEGRFRAPLLRPNGNADGCQYEREKVFHGTLTALDAAAGRHSSQGAGAAGSMQSLQVLYKSRARSGTISLVA